jgi:hypothetical protein
MGILHPLLVSAMDATISSPDRMVVEIAGCGRNCWTSSLQKLM